MEECPVKMQLIRKGKTKDVYRHPNGNIALVFKDDVTGDESGTQDAGGNHVVGKIEGVGSAALRLSNYFFDLFNKMGIHTHFVSTDLETNTMIVEPATPIGETGLEFICRFKAYGSFCRRYGKKYEGLDLDGLVEVCVKDDENGDPFITPETLFALDILNFPESQLAIDYTSQISYIIKNEFEKRGMEVIDLKLEFGFIDADLVLIDEISAGNMRVFDQNGKKLDYLELTQMFFA